MTLMELKPYRQLFNLVHFENTENESQWLHVWRQRAYNHFKMTGFPTRKNEGWKYINLAPLLDTPFSQQTILKQTREDSIGVASLLKDLPAGAGHFVIRNGEFNGALSQKGKELDGVVCCSLREACRSKPDLLKSLFTKRDIGDLAPFEAINTFNFSDGLFVSIPEGLSIETPIRITLLTDYQEAMPISLYPRVVIKVGEKANVSILLNVLNQATGKTFTNATATFHIEDEASLRLYHLNESVENGIDFLFNRYFLGRGSRLKIHGFACGDAGIVRNEHHILTEGEGADVNMEGVSLLKGHAELYHHVTVEHKVPGSVSNQLYKSILKDNAKAEFDSLVYIHKKAFKTDSKQLNKNMVLSDNAEMHSRPQLRVFADDVKAAHGSTVGQLDPTELFYLRSRGLDQQLAQSILMVGFVEEVLENISWEPLRQVLERTSQAAL